MKSTKTCKKKITGMLVAAMVLSQMQVSSIAAPVKVEKVFNDIKENVWYSDAISKWGQSGIIVGYEDGSFKPHKEVTRGELAMVIDRIFELQDTKNAKQYEDVEANQWYASAIAHISSEGIMNDFGEKFNPNAPVTREEAAYALAQVYKLQGSSSKVFLDYEEISDWAADAVEAVREGHYMIGMANGKFAPKASLTRAELMVVIDRLDARKAAEPEVQTKPTSNNAGNSKPTGGSSSGGNTADDDSTSSGNTENNKPDETAWKLVWSDEFDGTKVDPAKWTYNNGFLNLNEEKQVYQSKNATVNNGILTITAKKEDTTIDEVTHHYTSARMVSKGRYAQKYGKIEVRAKLPLGKSLWPAIWMLPENEEYTGWPTSGEIDIMESRGSVPNEVWGTLHYGDKKPNNTQSGSSYVFPEGESIEDFHTYGIEWQPGEIRWYVDGKLYQTQDRWYAVDAETGEQYAFPAPFDKEFHLLLNLALGGWYDGVGTNLEVDDSIFDGGKEYAMEVDYVRCYESSTGKYPEAVDPDTKKPEMPEEARKPLADGNLIYDNTYAQYGIQDNKEADLDFGEGWNLLYMNSFGGEGTATVETLHGQPFAKVAIGNPGTENYSVQMIQQTTLGRGRTYKLSFDAKAQEARSINFKIGGGEARGYAVYSGNYTETLDTNVKHMEKVFKMKDNTDTKARFEFNLGLSPKDVWIGNVKLEEVEEEAGSEDFNGPKQPLKNGSLIYNGAFDKGKLDRLTYWNLATQNGGKATMSVPESTRDLHIAVNEGGSNLNAINLNQQGLQLSENGNYTVIFTGSAEKEQPMSIKLIGEDGQTVYAEHLVTLTNEKQKYELLLKGEGSSTNKGQLVFELGGAGENNVVLDEISVIETRQDFSDVNIFPLKNGDFAKGQENWDGLFIEGGQGNVTFEDEAKFMITDLGANPWSVMLAQNKVPFSAGVKYVISFEASSEVPRDMIVKTEEEGTWRTFFEQNIALTPEKKKYSFEYTMPSDGDKQLGLKFLMGTTAEAPTVPHAVVIDNIVCEVKDGLNLKSQLQNGNFENIGDFKWHAWTVQPAAADFSYDNGAQIALHQSGEDTWQVTLEQEGIALKQGKTYCAEFKAEVTTPSSLRIAIQDRNNNEYAGEYAPTLDLYAGENQIILKNVTLYEK